MYEDYEQSSILTPKQKGVLRRREWSRVKWARRRAWCARHYNDFYRATRLVAYWCVMLACLKFIAEG